MTAGARWLASLATRRAGWILVVAAVFGALAVAGASRLRLDTSLRALLPATFPSIERLERLEARVGAQADLLVAIRSPSREANLAYGDVLAASLRERSDLNWVVFRQDRSFFHERALLFAGLGELLTLRQRVIEAVREQVRREAYGDFAVADAAPDASGASSDPFDRIDQELDAIDPKREIDARIPEYFEAGGGELVVIKARPVVPDTDFGFGARIAAEVKAQADSLNPTSYHPHMRVKIEGSYAQHSGRVNALSTEIVQGTSASLLALVVILWGYFRSARAVLMITVPLLAAATGALAFAWLAFGKLNMVSAFTFAVLLGLGIDFGIHILARYRHERARGAPPEQALGISLDTTGRATAAAAVSSALGFATLGAADFQGFAQFGLVAAAGLVFALVASVVVVPALVTVFERWRPWRPSRRPRSGAVARATAGWSRLAAVALAVGLAGGAWGAVVAPKLSFEYDLDALGPVKPPRDPTKPRAAGYRDAVGRAQTVAPAIALAGGRDQAEALQRQFDALLQLDDAQIAALVRDRALPGPEVLPDEPVEPAEDAEDEDLELFGDSDLDDPRFARLEELARSAHFGSPDTLAQLAAYGEERLREMRNRASAVFSVHRFVPTLQEEKLQVIADIRARIEAKKGGLSADAKHKLDRWVSYLNPKRPFGVDDLPPWVRRPFAEVSGEVGGYVVLATRGSKADANNSRAIYDAFFDLQTPDGSVPVAADFFVIPEIIDAVAADGPVVLGLASLVLLLTGGVVFRGAGGPLAVLATVALALGWLAVAFWQLDWKVNLFNVLALPLLVGMGQDDAIHLLTRLREEGGARLGTALRETSEAIVLTTLTTCCGFGGILFANHRGLQSLAWTAVLGMAACLVASIVVLPAGLLVLRGLGRPGPR